MPTVAASLKLVAMPAPPATPTGRPSAGQHNPVDQSYGGFDRPESTRMQHLLENLSNCILGLHIGGASAAAMSLRPRFRTGSRALRSHLQSRKVMPTA
jgi:hypothetical protein